MGVRLGTAERTAEPQTLRLLGRVAPDETRIYTITAASDGWITQSSPRNATGNLVRKGETLASFYSPEFLATQQAYLFSLGSPSRLQTSETEASGQLSPSRTNIQQYADNLRNLGMDDIQIAEITKTRQRAANIPIRSPLPGLIVARNITPGQKFSKGTELFKIADLRRVWIVADVFENEAHYVKPGQNAKVILPGRKIEFQAKVSDTLPQFDASTRTLKVRLDAGTPGYLLRPDMFVDVEVPVTLPSAISVPASAVLDSGLRKTVFVDLGNGLFEPRVVETGWRFANRVEIVKGLEAGERIVISGNFLIDSESRMELAASGMLGTLEKDPVCGDSVSVKKAAREGRTSIHGSKTYYFVSMKSKEQFDRDPARYSAKPVEGNDQPHH